MYSNIHIKFVGDESQYHYEITDVQNSERICGCMWLKLNGSKLSARDTMTLLAPNDGDIEIRGTGAGREILL